MSFATTAKVIKEVLKELWIDFRGYFFTNMSPDRNVRNWGPLQIGGLEKIIRIPPPTKEDKKWARRYAIASGGEIDAALETTIDQKQTWRTLFLVSRPSRVRNFLGLRVQQGFGGASRAVMDKVLDRDDATALYIILCKRNMGRKNSVTNIAQRSVNMMRWAVSAGSDNCVRLFANSANLFADKSIIGTGYIEESIINAARAGRTRYLDLFLNKGVKPEIFQAAYMHSYESSMTDRQRGYFLRWITEKDIARPDFLQKISGPDFLARANAAAIKAKAQAAMRNIRYLSTNFPAQSATGEIRFGLQVSILHLVKAEAARWLDKARDWGLEPRVFQAAYVGSGIPNLYPDPSHALNDDQRRFFLQWMASRNMADGALEEKAGVLRERANGPDYKEVLAEVHAESVTAETEGVKALHEAHEVQSEAIRERNRRIFYPDFSKSSAPPDKSGKAATKEIVVRAETPRRKPR